EGEPDGAILVGGVAADHEAADGAAAEAEDRDREPGPPEWPARDRHHATSTAIPAAAASAPPDSRPLAWSMPIACTNAIPPCACGRRVIGCVCATSWITEPGIRMWARIAPPWESMRGA